MQTVYNKTPAIAFDGMLADTNGNNDVLSRASEEATSFGYGLAVVAGTDPDVQAILPVGAAKLLGVSLHSHANEVNADNENLIQETSVFNVLHAGRIYVKVEEAVTPASPVFIRVAAGAGGTQKGAFRASADTATARASSGLRFITSAGANGFAQLEIDANAAIL